MRLFVLVEAVVGHAWVELILGVVIRLLLLQKMLLLSVAFLPRLNRGGLSRRLIGHMRLVLVIAGHDVIMRVAIVGYQVTLIPITVKLDLGWVDLVDGQQDVLTIHLDPDLMFILLSCCELSLAGVGSVGIIKLLHVILCEQVWVLIDIGRVC